MRAGLLGALLALGLGTLAPAAHADPASSPPASTPPASAAPAANTPPADLQSPEQRDTRNTAYSLPRGMWAFDAGALGLGGGDALAKLGVAYGVGAGLELQVNLAHLAVGILNFGAAWQFIDTPHFALGARAGIWYGKGSWVWILTEWGEDVLGDLEVLNIPLSLTASVPISKRLQFDLDIRYIYADIYGSIAARGELFRDAPFGMRQFAVRPGVRLFLTDNTEFDVLAQLPVYSARTFLRPQGDSKDDNEEFTKVPFSETWGAEFGLRSRFAESLFGSVRLHYSKIAQGFYGASFYPSFDVELRL